MNYFRHQNAGPDHDQYLRAQHDAVLAFKVDAMFSRRARRPISLPRPPFTRGR